MGTPPWKDSRGHSHYCTHTKLWTDAAGLDSDGFDKMGSQMRGSGANLSLQGPYRLQIAPRLALPLFPYWRAQ